MNYYPHHIGDFNNATRHLSRTERSLYRDMLDMYYDTEQALTLDFKLLCRKLMARTEEEVTGVEQVLNEFFTKGEQGWIHARCEEVIAEYRGQLEKKSAAGKASAEARAAAKAASEAAKTKGKATPVEQPLNTRSTNQEPRTNNQSSVPEGTGGKPPADLAVIAKSPDLMTKDELWTAGKSLLEQSGMPAKQCGSFVGKLVKDYGNEAVIEAVQAAVIERPADPVSYLKATCMKRTGERPNKQEALENKNRSIAAQLAEETA
jgi:uncharacterized protein YdaU (DUF1376 family)